MSPTNHTNTPMVFPTGSTVTATNASTGTIAPTGTITSLPAPTLTSCVCGPTLGPAVDVARYESLLPPLELLHDPHYALSTYDLLGPLGFQSPVEVGLAAAIGVGKISLPMAGQIYAAIVIGSTLVDAGAYAYEYQQLNCVTATPSPTVNPSAMFQFYRPWTPTPTHYPIPTIQ